MDTISHLSTLHVIAQVTITLIGFTGIVIAFKERATEDLSVTESLGLYALIFPSLTTLFFCFVPELLYILKLSEAAVWQLSNALFGSVKLFVLGTLLVLSRRRGETFKLTYGLTLPGAVLIVFHLLAGLGLIPWQEFIYILGLLWPLVVGIGIFIRLLGLRFK
jgi:hypothetical protein